MGQFEVLHMEKRMAISPVLERHISRVEEKIVKGEAMMVAWTPDNADPNKSKLNCELIPKDSTIQKAVFDRIEKAGIAKIRKNQNTCLEIIFSGSHETLSAMSHDKVKEWANDTLTWAQETWGKDNVVSATLHCDERTPHIHMVVVPIVTGKSRRTKSKEKKLEEQGITTQKYKIDDSRFRLSADEVYNTPRLKAYHTSYAKEVTNKYGLARGIEAEPGCHKKHQTSIEYNRQLMRETSELKTHVIRAQSEKNIVDYALDQAKQATAAAQSKRQAAEKELATVRDKKSKAEEELAKQVAEFEARLAKLQEKIDEKESELMDIEAKRQEYVDLSNQIVSQKQELAALTSPAALKELQSYPQRILDEIQSRYTLKGTVTAASETSKDLGNGKENFVTLTVKLDNLTRMLDIRLADGAVWDNEKALCYRDGSQVQLKAIADFFSKDLTDTAHEYLRSLYIKPEPKVLWTGKVNYIPYRIQQQIDGTCRLQTTENDYSKPKNPDGSCQKKWVNKASAASISACCATSSQVLFRAISSDGKIKYIIQNGGPAKVLESKYSSARREMSGKVAFALKHAENATHFTRILASKSCNVDVKIKRDTDNKITGMLFTDKATGISMTNIQLCDKMTVEVFNQAEVQGIWVEKSQYAINHHFSIPVYNEEEFRESIDEYEENRPEIENNVIMELIGILMISSGGGGGGGQRRRLDDKKKKTGQTMK